MLLSMILKQANVPTDQYVPSIRSGIGGVGVGTLYRIVFNSFRVSDEKSHEESDRS